MSTPVRPLARRIPFLMVTIIAASLATMGWLGYDRINRFAEEAERSRLEASTNQLLSSFQSMLARLRNETAWLAEAPPIAATVTGFATKSDRLAAQRLLAAHRRASAQYLSIAIWSADGKLVEVDGNPAIALAQRPIQREARSPGDTTAVIVGPLAARGDTVLYSATTSIPGANSTPIGYIVATRRLVSTAEGAALYGSLVGPNARILFGNSGDSLSLNLVRGLRAFDIPPVAGVGEYVTRDGTARFYSRADIPDTPWRLIIDEPRHLAVAPARRFALGMLGVAAVFIIIAGTLVWFVIGRVLRPLANVTQAVAGFAQGDHAQRVPVSGEDEIAQVGHAFNAMVDKVESRTDALLGSIHELQDSENRYRALIDHLPDGIMVHRNREIVFVNPTCARLFGVIDAQALIGKPILDFVDPSEHNMTLSRLDQVEVGTSVPVRELVLRRLDGKRVVVESTNMALMIDGKPAIQTILHDVTDRHALEERLRQSQKMEAVGRLAGGIAHDFNNLLTVIDAHAEFALRAEDEQSAAADIEEIRRASSSAARLTRQLLTFSRKQTAAPESLDLSDAVRDVLVMLNRLIGDDVQVQPDLGNNLWPVFADPSHIEQLLLNLALNARDAMPTGGRLSFTTANVEVGPDYRSASGEVIPAGEYVVLRVEDTGSGMSADVASKVFEPFFTTKGPGRGTGLGLSTVYGIVKQSDGHIWLYTEPGRGSAFKIMLPRHSAPQAPARVSPRVSDQRMSVVAGHVLVVEDQAFVRAAISRYLKNAGFLVTDVRDAEAALRVMESESGIDLVLTDMVMPGKSGAQLATELAVSHPGMPVVIMSGYSEEMTNRQWRLPENSKFVEKPVSPRTLIGVISDLLAGPEAVAPR